MAAVTLSLVIGILGNILSILVFSSPLPTFWRIFKKRSTENFKGLPYVCTLLSTSLWTYYGLIKPGATLILTINAAGTAFQCFYLTIFLIYAPKHSRKRTGFLALLLNGVFFGVILVATLFSKKGSERVFVVGAICSTISVSMYASPLVALRTVVRTKSVEFMPFFLSLFLFLNGGVWALYALLVKDIFVEIPNAIGFLLGSVQLAFYVYYKHYGKPALKDEEIKESFNGENTTYKDLEMGRSVSLPKQFSLSNMQTSSTTLAKHQSLPTQIIKTTSAKFNELLNFLQENDPINITPKHENSTQDQALLFNKGQSRPHMLQSKK